MILPLISIIIPVKNGIATIQKCLDAIFSQTLISQTEVIVIDSGSTDGTLEVLKQYKVRLYQIPPENFNHGGTRNYGVSLAKGEFVVMTVQDASAATNNWLEVMLAHFLKDDKVCAVVGQQVVPHLKNVNPHQWHRPVSNPRVIVTYFEEPSDYFNMSGKAQDDCSFYDDVNTMYRKTALIEHPFESIEFGEDMLMIKHLLSHQKAVVYNCIASVWHYHYLDKEYVYKLTFTELYFRHLIFGYTPNIAYTSKEVLLIIYRNFKFRAQLKWILHNIQILRYRQKAHQDFVRAKSLKKDGLEAFYKKMNPKVVQGKSAQ